MPLLEAVHTTSLLVVMIVLRVFILPKKVRLFKTANYVEKHAKTADTIDT